jgi:hypothetical protein
MRGRAGAGEWPRPGGLCSKLLHNPPAAIGRPVRRRGINCTDIRSLVSEGCSRTIERSRPTGALRSGPVHEAAHTAFLLHCGGRRWDSSHFTVPKSPLVHLKRRGHELPAPRTARAAGGVRGRPPVSIAAGQCRVVVKDPWPSPPHCQAVMIEFVAVHCGSVSRLTCRFARRGAVSALRFHRSGQRSRVPLPGDAGPADAGAAQREEARHRPSPAGLSSPLPGDR